MVEVNLLVNNYKQQWELGLERLYTSFQYNGVTVGVKQEEFITIRNNGDIFRNNHVIEKLSISGLYKDIVGEFMKMFTVDHVDLGLSVDEEGNIRKGDKILYSRVEQGIENLVPMGYRGRYGEEGQTSPTYGVGYFAGTSEVKIMLNREFPEDYLLGTFSPSTVSRIREEYDTLRETLTLSEMEDNPQLIVKLEKADNAFATPERSVELGVNNITIMSDRTNYEPLDVIEMVERFLQRLTTSWKNIELEKDVTIQDIEFEINYLTSYNDLKGVHSYIKDIDPEDLEDLQVLEVVTINKHTKERKSLYISKGIIVIYMENDSPESLLLDVFNQLLNNYNVSTQLIFEKQERFTKLELT